MFSRQLIVLLVLCFLSVTVLGMPFGKFKLNDLFMHVYYKLYTTGGIQRDEVL